MTRERVDSHPVRTAAAQQTGTVVAGALSSGAGGSLGLVYLASLSSYDLPVSRVDLLIAVGLSIVGAALPSVWAQLRALAATVRTAEPEVTPWRDPRNDSGQRLRSYTGAIVDQALDELAARRADEARPRAASQPEPVDEEPVAAAAWPARAARSGPAGTSTYPAVGSARSMIAPGTERQRTEPPGGAPSADPPRYGDHAAVEPVPQHGVDPYGPWTGAQAATQDERIARQHGPRAARIQDATGPRSTRRPRADGGR